MAAATIHSLSVRARARVARRDLETLIEDAVVTILGADGSDPSLEAKQRGVDIVERK
jgi:hypothetical protein